MTRDEKEMQLIDLDCQIGERLAILSAAQEEEVFCDLPEVDALRIIHMTDEELDQAILARQNWLLQHWLFPEQQATEPAA